MGLVSGGNKDYLWGMKDISFKGGMQADNNGGWV